MRSMRFEGDADRLAFAQQLRLTEHIVDLLGAQALGERHRVRSRIARRSGTARLRGRRRLAGEEVVARGHEVHRSRHTAKFRLAGVADSHHGQASNLDFFRSKANSRGPRASISPIPSSRPNATPSACRPQKAARRSSDHRSFGNAQSLEQRSRRRDGVDLHGSTMGSARMRRPCPWRWIAMDCPRSRPSDAANTLEFAVRLPTPQGLRRFPADRGSVVARCAFAQAREPVSAVECDVGAAPSPGSPR